MAYIYHERQSGSLCGLHCLNALLQCPSFKAGDLEHIAQKLDEKEKELMAENGHTRDYQQFLAEGSGNVVHGGNFSQQVLEEALLQWGLGVTSINHPDMRAFRSHPKMAAGYICNLNDHWFTTRPINGEWWNLDSLLPAPRLLDQNFMEEVRRQGCTMLVVRVTLPEPPDPKQMKKLRYGRLWTMEEALIASGQSPGSHEEETQAPPMAMRAPTSAYSQNRGITTAHTQHKAWAPTLSNDPGVPEGNLQSVQHISDHTHEEVVRGETMHRPHEFEHGARRPAAAATATAMHAETITTAPDDAGHARSELLGTNRRDLPSDKDLGSHPVSPGAHAEGQGYTPDDTSKIRLTIRLPGGGKMKRSFRRSNRVGLVIVWLHGQGVDMHRHRLRSEVNGALVDYLRLQDTGLRNGEVLVVEHVAM